MSPPSAGPGVFAPARAAAAPRRGPARHPHAVRDVGDERRLDALGGDPVAVGRHPLLGPLVRQARPVWWPAPSRGSSPPTPGTACPRPSVAWHGLVIPAWRAYSSGAPGGAARSRAVWPACHGIGGRPGQWRSRYTMRPSNPAAPAARPPHNRSAHLGAPPPRPAGRSPWAARSAGAPKGWARRSLWGARTRAGAPGRPGCARPPTR